MTLNILLWLKLLQKSVDINRGDDVEGGIDVVDTLQEGATLLLW
jgi:hypothetical protein